MATKAQSITLGWKDQLDRHRYYSVLAIQTDDFGIFKHLAAQDLMDNIDHGAMLQAATDDDTTIAAKLTQLNVDTCKAGEAFMNSVTDVMEANKEKNLREDGWKALLEDQRAKGKDRMVEKIDEVFDKAKEYIVSSPKNARSPAANIFIKGSDLAMQVFDLVVQNMQKLINHVLDFVRKVFKVVKTAWETVKSGVTSVVNLIKRIGWFSSMVQQAGHLVKFVGRCNWPASVAFSVATAGTSNLVHTLAQSGIKLEKKSVTRDEDSGTIESRINLEIPSDSDGASLFKRAVDGLGNDGHFIPNDWYGAPPPSAAPIAAF
ncbi:MAG: hypothetical protein Q9228_003686 [Teloschistes exilis]